MPISPQAITVVFMSLMIININGVKMGAAKSLAMTYSDREYLLYYIDRKEHSNIKKLLEKRPDLLNHKLTEKTKMSPLFRTAYNGDFQTTAFLVQQCGAAVNQPTDHGETPLVAAVKRNHIRVVRYLLEHGADYKFMTPYGLSTLEFAVLPGYYQIASLIYERSKEKLRAPEEYEQLGKQYNYRYVNYPMFLQHLEKLIAVENVPDFLRKYKKVYRDPVVDPRQTWKEWTKRQMEFKDPPIVERDDLPAELQPQNRKFGKVSTFLSSFAMSPLTQQPSYHPKSKSVVAESDQEIKMGQHTNEDIEVRTMP